MPAAHGALSREVDDATISSIEAMRAGRPLSGSTGPLWRYRSSPPATSDENCLSHALRSSRRGRSGPGRFRQGLHTSALLPTTIALRNLVHSDPDQQLPRPDQSAQPPRTPLYVGPVLAVWAARFLGECCSGHDVAGRSSARTRTPRSADSRPDTPPIASTLSHHVEPFRGIDSARD